MQLVEVAKRALMCVRTTSVLPFTAQETQHLPLVWRHRRRASIDCGVQPAAICQQGQHCAARAGVLANKVLSMGGKNLSVFVFLTIAGESEMNKMDRENFLSLSDNFLAEYPSTPSTDGGPVEKSQRR